MKRIVEVIEAEGGFEAVMGENLLLMCGVYFYTGKLVGVNEDHIELENPQLVFQSGDNTTGDWAEADAMPSPWRVMKQAIESWGPAKC